MFPTPLVDSCTLYVLLLVLLKRQDLIQKLSNMQYLNKISLMILTNLEMTFYWWGIKVTKNPFTVILASFLITGVVGLGLLRFRFVFGKCFGIYEALNNMMNFEGRKAEQINYGYHRILNTIIIRGGSKNILLKMRDKTS